MSHSSMSISADGVRETRANPGVFRWTKVGWLGWVCCACLGCLTPVTDRLDAIYTELQLTRQEMAEMNARMAETNRRLENIEALLKRFPFLKPAGQLPETDASGSPAKDTSAEYGDTSGGGR